ncbi:MAG: hypothetical protein LAO07_09880, partial [Acidobacteriia bacterium]|nr:hypothetical protein [Terriglobia bacterium]
MDLSHKLVARIFEDDDWLRYQFKNQPRPSASKAEHSEPGSLRRLAGEWFNESDDGAECRAAPYLRKLGVRIAGLIYVNEPQREIQLAFFEPATGDKTAEYMIPYVWGHGRDAAWRKHASGLVDQFFLLMRNYQDPWAEDPASVPEWAMDLPYSFLEPRLAPTLGAARREESEPYFRELEVRARFGIHYCPWGEVLFYCLAWRWLIRSAVARNQDGEMSAPLGLVGEEALWQSELWSVDESSSDLLPEHRLSRWICGREDLVLVDSISKIPKRVAFRLE